MKQMRAVRSRNGGSEGCPVGAQVPSVALRTEFFLILKVCSSWVKLLKLLLTRPKHFVCCVAPKPQIESAPCVLGPAVFCSLFGTRSSTQHPCRLVAPHYR